MSVRVIVFGIDGGDWKFIDEGIREGSLPNFSKIKREGFHSILESTIPPVTPVAWPSLFTGMNPGKTGVFGFQGKDKGDYSLSRIVNRDFFSGSCFWEILNSYGKKTYLINLPMTYPPRKVLGGLKSGMFTPSEESESTYPEDFEVEIRETVPDYKIFTPPRTQIKKGTYFENLLKVTGDRAQLILHLLSKKDWDLIAVNFRSTDVIGHYFLGYKLGDCEEKEKPLGANVLKVYEQIDSILGKIMDRMDEETIMFIVSDHGIDYWKVGEPVRVVNFHEWLSRKGFLKTKSKKVSSFFDVNKAYYWFLNRGIDLKVLLPKKVQSKAKSCVSMIDWDKSQAFLSHYSFRHGGITINLDGREKSGSVKKEDYENVRNSILKKLRSFKDGTGEGLVEKVWKREDIYSGDSVEVAPDIVFRLRKNYTARNTFSKHLFTNKEEYGGIHRSDGVFAAFGKPIKNGSIENSSIQDIHPTVLKCFGVSPENCVDGNVIPIFSSAFKTEEPVKKEKDSSRDKTERVSKKEEEKIKKRLEQLGYM